MVGAFSKALLLSALTFCCLIVPCLTQNHLRQNFHQKAIRGYEKLDSIVLPVVAKQLRRLHHRRTVRQIGTHKLHKHYGDAWLVEGFQNSRGCPKAAQQFKVFEYRKEWYAVVASSALENNTEIYDFTTERGCGKLLNVLPTRSAFDFEIVKTSDGIRIVVLEKLPIVYPHKRIGSTVFSVKFEANFTISSSRREVLRSEEPTCITSWEQFGIPHVAICNGKSRNFNGVESYWSTSNIFCATGGYFDRCDEIKTHFPQAIRHFQIFSKHYLAVANSPNGTDGEHVPAEVLRYSLRTKSYEHLQFLPAKSAKDICFLVVGSGLAADHFLIVLNEFILDLNGTVTKDAVAYVSKFAGEKFEPFQAIQLSSKRVTSCLSYQTKDGQSLVVFATSWGADVYQYNGWRFVPVVQYSKHALGSGIRHLGALEMNQKIFITAANSNPSLSERDNLFLPIFSRQLNASLSTMYTQNITSCRQMRTELEVNPLQLLVDIYPQAVKKNDSVIRLGNVEFNSLFANRIMTNEVEVKKNNSRLGASQIFQLQNVSKKVDEISNRLKVLSRKIKLAVRTSGDYTFNGNVRINDLRSSCINGGCVIGNLTAIDVNSVNVGEAYRQAITLNDSSMPSLHVKKLIVEKQINTTSLSGHNITDFFEVHKDNNFKRMKIHGNLHVHGNLDVGGLVNGHSFSTASLLLRNGNQNLNWTLKANELKLSKLKTRFINERDIDHLYQHAISKSENFTLLQPKFFSETTVSKLSLSGLLNRVNLTDLDRNAMKLNGDQIVTGIHGYSSANLGQAHLNGSLNGHRFPSDFIFVRESDLLKIKKMQIIRDTAFSSLSVAESVAGISVVEGRWSTNFLKKTSNQTQVIVGSKRFDKVISNHSITSNTLNKRPMDKFVTDTSLYGHPEELLTYDSVDIQGEVTFEKPLSVTDAEGVGLQQLEENGMLLSTENFPPHHSFTFASSVTVIGDLSTDTLDGVPSSGFVTREKKGPLLLSGRKTFTQPVSMKNTFTLLYTLNGYDLGELWNRSLRIDGDQTLPGSLLIKNNVDVVRLQVAKLPFVPLNSAGLVAGKKQFQELKVEGDWFADVLDVTGLINDVDLSLWPSDTIMKNGKNQRITSQKSIRSVTARNVMVNTIDDLDIKQMLNVPLLHQPVTIYSDLIIDGKFLSNNLRLNGSIDGVNSNAPLSWMRYNVNQNLSGTITIKGSLEALDFRQDSWIVNRVRLDDILSRAIRTNEPQRFSSLRFHRIIVDDLILGGLIQGVNVTRDLVLKDGSQQHQRITGTKSFSGQLVSESFHVSDKLNNVNPREVCQTSIPPQTSKWIVYGNVKIQQNAKLNVDNVNNVSLSDIKSNIWLKAANVVVRSNQTFKEAIMDGLLSEMALSNYNLTDLYRRSVKVSSKSEQNVTANHRFQTVRITGQMKADLMNSPKINNVGISDLTSLVLLRDVEQTISSTIMFQDVVVQNVAVQGKVNGINVSESMMRKDQDNVITGRKTVKSIQVTGNVETCNKCLIDTYDISDWASRSVLRTGNFTLNGSQFESVSFQQSLELLGSLNNVTVSRDELLTISDEQQIKGNISLSSQLPENIQYPSNDGSMHQLATEDFIVAARFSNLEVEGLYDGIDLRRYYDRSVRRNSNVFAVPIRISKLISINVEDLTVDSTIRDIIELPTNETHHFAASTPTELSLKRQPMPGLIKKIDSVVSRQPSELRYFEEIDVPHKLPPTVDAVYAWKNPYRGIELCTYSGLTGEFYFGSSPSPLLKDVDVTDVSSLSKTEDFAVATLARRGEKKHDSYIFSQASTSNMLNQTISTNFPIGITSFIVEQNMSCFLFLEKTSESPIYCKTLLSNSSYSLAQLLPTLDARLVTVSSNYSSGLPLLYISSLANRGYDQITLWKFNSSSKLFELSKSKATLQVIAMDSICNENICLLATLAPSKPAAIPGQVVIWRLSDDGTLIRVQRIAFSEPMDIKFTLLPDGRIALLILQNSGIDNVYVYIWRGLLQFQHELTIRAPGAHDLQLISDKSMLVLALAVDPPINRLSHGPVRMFRANFIGI